VQPSVPSVALAARFPPGSTVPRVGAALLLLATLTGFHLATIRAGQYWDDDFALYILHARNLAEGRPYSSTGYIYNPQYPWLGPQSYPPGFPVLLAPVYGTFGLALRPMKVLVVLFLGAALCVVLLYLAGELPFSWALAATACIGMNPFISEFKDAVVSEIPFLFFVWTSLLLVRHYTLRIEGDARAPIGPWLVVGLFLFLSTVTRSPGIVLLPSLILYHLLRFRRITRASLVAVALALALYELQDLLIRPALSYSDQFRGRGLWLFRNLAYYPSSLAEFWASGLLPALHRVLTVGLLALAALGFASRCRRPSMLEVFTALYVGLILLWPASGGTRYLLPVFPAWILYAAVGALRLRERRPMVARVVAAALAVAIGSTYLVKYGRTDFGPLRAGVETPGAADLFRFLRDQTAPDSVLIVRRPRALALYTGRRASVYHKADDESLLAYFRQVGATHVVLGPFDSDFQLADLIHHRPEQFGPLYESAEYRVFGFGSPLPGRSSGR
jgi:hypothetical protein